MRLNTTTWKHYKVGELFRLEPTKGVTSDLLIEGHDIPYIAAKKEDNGLRQMCQKEGFEDWISKGNCICFIQLGAGSGGFANYIPEDFIGMSGKTSCGYIDNKMNPPIGLFLATILSQERPKYSFGRSWTGDRLKETKIKLPTLYDVKGLPIIDETKTYSSNGYIPDWGFMESYIKSLNDRPITTKVPNSKIQLKCKKHKEFKIGNLFKKIYKSKSYSFQELEEKNKDNLNSITYISRTDLNNGCRGYVLNDETFQVEKGNALTIGDTTATCFYQADKFITGDHMVILRDDSWLNLETGLFIKSIIQKEKYRYSYGRAFTMEKIRNTNILLPVTDEGEPDWEYMKDYIKLFPYSDRI